MCKFHLNKYIYSTNISSVCLSVRLQKAETWKYGNAFFLTPNSDNFFVEHYSYIWVSILQISCMSVCQSGYKRLNFKNIKTFISQLIFKINKFLFLKFHKINDSLTILSIYLKILKMLLKVGDFFLIYVFYFIFIFIYIFFLIQRASWLMDVVSLV